MIPISVPSPGRTRVLSITDKVTPQDIRADSSDDDKMFDDFSAVPKIGTPKGQGNLRRLLVRKSQSKRSGSMGAEPTGDNSILIRPKLASDDSSVKERKPFSFDNTDNVSQRKPFSFDNVDTDVKQRKPFSFGNDNTENKSSGTGSSSTEILSIAPKPRITEHPTITINNEKMQLKPKAKNSAPPRGLRNRPRRKKKSYLLYCW